MTLFVTLPALDYLFTMLGFFCKTAACYYHNGMDALDAAQPHQFAWKARHNSCDDP